MGAGKLAPAPVMSCAEALKLHKAMTEAANAVGIRYFIMRFPRGCMNG